jgi:hypothetical protein
LKVALDLSSHLRGHAADITDGLADLPGDLGKLVGAEDDEGQPQDEYELQRAHPKEIHARLPAP